MQETVTGFFFYILYTELKINQSPSPQFQNQSPPPSALCSFLKIGRIDKVVNKHTADYQLSYFYGLLSTLSLQSIFFSKPVYSTVVAENFQIYSDTITANKFYKSSFFNFSHALKQNSSPRILSLYPKSERNCPFLLNSIFWRYLFLREKREKKVMELKKLPKLPKIFVTSFDKFHHLTTLTFFVYVLLCNNLASSMLNCEGFLT